MSLTTIRLILIAIILILSVILARSPEAIEIRELSVQYQKFFEPNFTPYFPGSQDERVTLHINSDLLPGVFWNNRIHGTTDASQYRWIGWNFTLGARITPDLSFNLLEHHSQHMLDGKNTFHFPCEDSFGFTLFLVRPSLGRSLF